MFNYVYQESLKRAKHKIWIISDLQQSNPEYAKECLDISMKDYKQMGSPADMIWYLGDSIEGSNLEHLQKMTQMQEQAFEATDLPLCYVIGNHDFDYTRNIKNVPFPTIPFFEMVKAHEGWHTSTSYTEPYFKVPLGNFMVYFFSDHIAEDMSWLVSHGGVHGATEQYPYMGLYAQIREEIASEKRPVITASHYAYPGGNREAYLMSKLFPLPENVKIHFYGHAHIGDYKWAKEHAYRRISWADWHDIPQINVSSFEHIRGQKCRSVFLHIYEDDSMGIFFRNHDDQMFSEVYFPAKEQYAHGMHEECK